MDIVQETLYRYLNSSIDFPNENSEKAWLLKVAANLCGSYWRSSWYRRLLPLTGNHDVPHNETPEKMIMEKEKNQNILSAVLHLPPKYREVIHLYYYEELDIETISRITGKKKSTIQTQLDRGRKIL